MYINPVVYTYVYIYIFLDIYVYKCFIAVRYRNVYFSITKLLDECFLSYLSSVECTHTDQFPQSG